VSSAAGDRLPRSQRLIEVVQRPRSRGQHRSHLTGNNLVGDHFYSCADSQGHSIDSANQLNLFVL
jgi:hypothetical protein